MTEREKSRSTLDEIIVDAVGKQLEQAARYDHVLLDREMSYDACREVVMAVVEPWPHLQTISGGGLRIVTEHVSTLTMEKSTYEYECAKFGGRCALVARAAEGGR